MVQNDVNAIIDGTIIDNRNDGQPERIKIAEWYAVIHCERARH